MQLFPDHQVTSASQIAYNEWSDNLESNNFSQKIIVVPLVTDENHSLGVLPNPGGLNPVSCITGRFYHLSHQRTKLPLFKPVISTSIKTFIILCYNW